MVKTKTANGEDQDRLGQDHDLKKMVLRPVLRPSSLLLIFTSAEARLTFTVKPDHFILCVGRLL